MDFIFKKFHSSVQCIFVDFLNVQQDLSAMFTLLTSYKKSDQFVWRTLHLRCQKMLPSELLIVLSHIFVQFVLNDRLLLLLLLLTYSIFHFIPET